MSSLQKSDLASPLVLTSAVLSHPGPIRKINEDACLEAPDIGLWAVADGMGGHEGGQFASWTVIDCLDFNPDRSAEGLFIRDVVDRLREANLRIQDISQTRFGGRAIGSTAVVLLVYGCKAICLWVGDSRFYLLRGGTLRQVNQDHTHVAELVKRGLLKPEEIATHPLRNIITRAVGARKSLHIDRCDVDIRPGDIFLLCSDGLNKVLSDNEIRAILVRGTCERVANDLIRTAMARAATDNITVCVVAAAAAPTAEKGRPCAKDLPDTDDTRR